MPKVQAREKMGGGDDRVVQMVDCLRKRENRRVQLHFVFQCRHQGGERAGGVAQRWSVCRACKKPKPQNGKKTTFKSNI
jgi:hypothetical protein